jgi:hypothetical protein
MSRNKGGRPPLPVRTDALDRDAMRKRIKRAREAALRPPKPPKPIPPPIPKAPKESAWKRSIDAAALRLLREQGAITAFDRAPIFDRVKPGPGGVPIADPDLPAPGTYDGGRTTGPYAIAARDADLAELVAKRDAEAHSGRPPPGLKMNQWTPEQLAAEKRWLQQRNPVIYAPSIGFSQPSMRDSIQPQFGFDPMEYP